MTFLTKVINKLIPYKISQGVTIALYSDTLNICPICGHYSKGFYPLGLDIPVLKEKQVVGAGIRNGGCYKCHSLDRERLIYTYLKDELHVFENKELKILHFAPEKNISRILSTIGFEKYICGDLFADGYTYPDYVQNMNVLDIPFDENTFDLIICNHLLEHVPDDIAAMKELYRVLKPNGKAILQVPFSKNSDKTFEDFTVTDPSQRERVFGQFDHVRIYGADYFQRLESVGFKTNQINISKQYPKHGLNPDEDIFIGIKPAKR